MRGSPTTYFLGKVCLARNLETKIPEECLINKLTYHFEEGIIRARLGRQIKTIQGIYQKVMRLRTNIETIDRGNLNQAVKEIIATITTITTNQRITRTETINHN